MPVYISPTDYGFANAADLAKMAGTLQGETKVGGNLYDRAVIADVLFNRAYGGDPIFARYNTTKADGTTYTGPVGQAANPVQFNVWMPTIAGKANGGYQSGTEMQGIISNLIKDPTSWDRLSPTQQQNVSMNLTALRGVFGSYDPNKGNLPNGEGTYTPQGGPLQGITGGATYYSNPKYNAPSQMATHINLGLNQGVNHGDNVFYAGNPAKTQEMAQRMRAFDRLQAATELSVGDATEGGYRENDAGMLARMAFRGPDLPSNGTSLPLPPGRPSDADLQSYAQALQGGPLDRFSDGITQGLQSAGNSILDTFSGALNRLPTAEEFRGRINDIQTGARSLFDQLGDIAGSAEAKTFAQSTGIDPSQYVLNDIYRLGLNRDVDAGSAASQLEVLRNQGGQSLYNQLANSQEGRTLALGNFFENTLNRGIDQSGLGYYLSELGAGKSMSDVQREILSSPEALSLGYKPEQIADLIGNFNLPYMQGVNVPSPLFQPGPLTGGNYNLPAQPGVDIGNPFPTSPLQGGNYNLDPLKPVDTGNPFQAPDLVKGDYNLSPLNPVDVKNPLFQPDPLTGGNFNLPGQPLPSTPIQPVGPDGFTVSPVGPGAETSPVGPGDTQYPVGPGATTYPVGPGQLTTPVGPGQAANPIAPTETRPVGPEGFEVSPVAPPALTPTVPAPAAVPAFDPGQYLSANPDVAASGMSPLDHYVRFGYKEGRAIDTAGDRLPQNFDGTAYLAANPDVAAFGMNPFEHFARFGAAEGRSLSPTGFTNANVSGNVGNESFNGFNGADYLAANRDVAASGMSPLAHFVKYGLGEGRAIDTAGHHLPQNFDGNAYLAQNPDVARAGMSPLEHYLMSGAREGRAAPTLNNPTAFTAADVSQGIGPTGNGTWDGTFNGADYLAANRDVAASGMDALTHFVRYGLGEGRAIDTAGHHLNQNFDGNAYLAANPDVARAGMSPLEHYLMSGAHEGRAAPIGTNPYQFSNFNVSQGLGPIGNGSFGLGGITSSAPGGMGTIAPMQSPTPTANAPSADFSNPFGFSGLNAGVYTPPDDGRGRGGGFVGWESASENALQGSGGASGSAWTYTDKDGNPQIATFDPKKSENAYLAGQVAQNQAQIEAGRLSVANNPNLWNFGATNLLNSVAASNYQPAPIYSTATQATYALPPAMPAPFNSPLPVMNQGLQVNPYGGFGLISAF